MTIENMATCRLGCQHTFGLRNALRTMAFPVNVVVDPHAPDLTCQSDDKVSDVKMRLAQHWAMDMKKDKSYVDNNLTLWHQQDELSDDTDSTLQNIADSDKPSNIADSDKP